METVAKGPTGTSAGSPEPAPAVGLRVREVLAASTLAGARVLAGSGGLDRVVARLNVMEVPDILPWVKPHELLLTTGYPLRDDPDALVDLVVGLDRRGLAALAVKLHRYLDELPAPVLAEADRRNFPIIEFPAGVGFDDVLNQVLGELLNRQAAVLARSEEVHRALVAVVLDGGGLDDLAAELARILAGPIMITSPDGRVVARAGDPAELDRLARGELFDPAGRLRAGAVPAAGTPPHAVVPIVAGRIDHGRIVAFSATALTDADVHALERAATVAALAITKRLAVAAVEGKYRADFLRDVLSGRVADPAEAVAHARGFGWHIDRPLLVLVAELEPDPAHAAAGGPELRPARERFVAAWQAVVRLRDPAAPVVSFTDEVVVLLGVPRDGDTERLVADLHRQVRADAGLGGLPCSVGVSRPAPGPEALPVAYGQAGTALRIGRRLAGRGSRAHFDDLGVHRLISLIPDQAEVRGFVADVLGELAGPGPGYADLRHTLSVLLDNNCNVAHAARLLHFHYNTMRYRITKLERMLGPFTSRAALRLDIALALRVHQSHPAVPAATGRW